MSVLLAFLDLGKGMGAAWGQRAWHWDPCLPLPGHGVGARCCAGQCTWRASSFGTWLNTLLPSSFSSYRALFQSCYLLVLMCTLWENDNSTGVFPCTRGFSHSCSLQFARAVRSFFTHFMLCSLWRLEQQQLLSWFSSWSPLIISSVGLKHQQWKGRFFWELISLKAWVSTARGHVVWCLNARDNCNYFIAEHTQLFTFSAFFSGVTSCGCSHIFSLLWASLSMHCSFSLSPALLISY